MMVTYARMHAYGRPIQIVLPWSQLCTCRTGKQPVSELGSADTRPQPGVLML